MVEKRGRTDLRKLELRRETGRIRLSGCLVLSLASSVSGFILQPPMGSSLFFCQGQTPGSDCFPLTLRKGRLGHGDHVRRNYIRQRVTTSSVSSDCSTPNDKTDKPERYQELPGRARIPDASSLRTQGLSKFHQSILSRSSHRQRFVTGRYPLRVTVQDTPTRRWLGIGRDALAATAQLFVNGTTVDRSLASFDRFQWIDEEELDEVTNRYTLELLAEIHIRNPGYINVLPAHGPGASAAIQRVAAEHSWNQWKRNAAVFEQIESTRWQAPYRDRIWVTGFSLASSRGYLHSIDAETGHIEAVSDRTSGFIRWPNEANSVLLPRYTVDETSGEYRQSSRVDELDDALLISDGFLVPGKDKGGLYIVKSPGNDKAERNVCLTGGPNMGEPWFYHRAIWVDLTGDGRKSILTARAKPPSLLKSSGRTSTEKFNAKTGQLVWLEMPTPHAVDETTGRALEQDGTLFDPFDARHIPWKIHVLDQGPDVMFTVADMDTTDDTVEVISSQFFGGCVTLHSIRRGPEPRVTFRRTLDDKCGAAFGSILSDLDVTGVGNDGFRSDRVVVDSGSTIQTQKPGDSFSHLLVTSHECSFDVESNDASLPGAGRNGGSLFAYRVPNGTDAWKVEPWLRSTIASGFRVRGQIGNMINPGAPGFVYTFYPTKNGDGASNGKRPLIAVAGDCAESAYVYRPAGRCEDSLAPHVDPSARYELICEIECGATVGSIGIGYDNFCSADQKTGYAKLYIPCYEKDKVYVFAMGDGGGDHVTAEEGGW